MSAPNPPHQSSILTKLIPRRLLNSLSLHYFSLQIFIQDSILGSSRMHYVVIGCAYVFFLVFGIGSKNLLGFDPWYYFHWTESLVSGIYSVLHNKPYYPTSTRPAYSIAHGYILVEIFCVLLSAAALVAFFVTGFRSYQILPSAHRTTSQSSVTDSKSATQHAPKSIVHKIASSLTSRFSGRNSFGHATTFTPINPYSDVKELYIWSYHPFLKNVFILFNPFQLLLFMVLKRTDSIVLKLILLIIIVSLTIIFYLLVHLFEQKSRSEKNLAAQVMQVQQDFYVRWHQARRIAEREVIQELMDEGEMDPEMTNRLSNVHNRNMRRRTVQDDSNSFDMPVSRSSTRSRGSAHSEASGDDDADGLRVIPPVSSSVRNRPMVSAPSSGATVNPFQSKKSKR